MKPEARIAVSEILSRLPLFRGLLPEELGLIAAGSRELRASKHEVLFHKGDQPAEMHVLVTGQVRLFIPSAAGTEKVVQMLGPGGTFGEAVLFLDRPYPVTAQVTTDSLLLTIAKRTLLDAIDAHPLFSRKMLASLSQRLHELLADTEACSMRTSAQRVLCFLSQSLPAAAIIPYDIQLPASKQTLASQLNLAPETLSRVLGNLVEAGVIGVQGRTITILSRQGLLDFGG